MSFNIAKATDFVRKMEISGTRGVMPMGAEAEVGEVFDKAKNQAQVVGAGVFSFAQGVTPRVRAAISDAALLAQLAANKRVSSEKDPKKWFSEYADVLQNIGWTVQQTNWSNYTAEGMAAEVHEKVIEVLTAALGPAPAALAIVKATLNAMLQMKDNSPWITLFSRETQKAKMSHFQIGLVEKEEASDVFISLLACLVEAEQEITRVLFFKWKEARAAFKADGAKISVNLSSINDLAPIIQAKVRAYQYDYLSTILNV